MTAPTQGNHPQPHPQPHPEKAGGPLRRIARYVMALAALSVLPVLGLIAPGSGTAAPADGPDLDPKAAAARSAERMERAGIVDVPVSFEVVNRNRSGLACNTDGKTYTVRGHLTLPAALATASTALPPVTVYQHGLQSGEWYWRVDVPGYHHAEEMARRGHASLTVDRLGHGASDRPDGRQLCLGGEADITQQIAGQLRDGTYATEGGDTVRRFGEVVLAGHDRGAQIAQIAAYSFPDDFDGLILSGWADSGLTDEDDARFFAALTSCMQGGVPSVDAADAPGYVHLDVGERDFVRGNFRRTGTDPRVLATAVGLQNRLPCGVLVSQLEGVLVDTRRVGEIEVPVALVEGERDVRVRGAAEHRERFTSAPDTALHTVPGAGHFLGLEPGARGTQDFLAGWLDAKGLAP
ncbi:alpha/beta hydrolase [Streptomyces sp. NPDC093252]|uniref:alpha/beta hydrolase n=1 Tax=Streptomyces sp. NPDC093252 TaxID=3154980 RepID=UPI00341FD0FF